MASEVRPKRIYFAVRHPQWQGEAFIQRWRQHGRLAMQFMAEQSWAHVNRYVHGDRIYLQGFPNSGPVYDGMGIVFFNSIWSREQHLANANARNILLLDEDETFAHRVNQHGMVCQESVFEGGQNPIFKWVQVYKASAGCSLSMLDQYLRLHRESLLSGSHSEVQSWIENRPLPPESGAGWGLQADAIVEIGFQSIEAIQSLLERYRDVSPSANPSITCTLNMLVQDHELKGAAKP